MAIEALLRRGTEAENAVFTGGVGEVVYLIDKHKMVHHNGTNVGGRAVLNEYAVTVTGTANVWEISIPEIDSYDELRMFVLRIPNVNTGAVIARINSLAYVNVVFKDPSVGSTNFLSGGEIVANGVYIVTQQFDGGSLVVESLDAGGGGGLIGYQVFTSSGSYTKATNAPSYVIVEVLGGGGGGAPGSGGGSAGGTSSFGSHCSATGGGGGQGGSTSFTQNGGTGGLGSGGDINAQGQAGQSVRGGSTFGIGGSSRYSGGGNENQNGLLGAGGGGFEAGSNMSGGGGAGGYSMKKIDEGSLSASETVTIGAGGSGAGDGGPGLVIVWEYA